MDFFERFLTKIVEDKNSIMGSYGHQQGEDSQHKNDLAEGIDLHELLSRVDFRKRWLYRGSFTTPPLLEGVLWHIVDDV